MKNPIISFSIFTIFAFIHFPIEAQELTGNQLKALQKDDVELVQKEFSETDYSRCYTIQQSPYSLLAVAIKMESESIFDFLVAHKVDVNQICEEKTPLMYAAKYGKLSFAKKLIDAGADTNLKTVDGETAKDYAKRYQQIEVYKLLSGDVTPFSDGPIVFYQNQKIWKYQIDSSEDVVITKNQEIQKSTPLYCYVDETRDRFQFQLKDKLSIEKSTYKLPNKMLVLSDIEGNFKGFKTILTGNKIIDKDFNWTFGNNHLVLLGDFFDRGMNVTECLWLIYKLESDAEKHGGKVHFLLGNHELMNLKGSFKYLREKYVQSAEQLNLPYKDWYSPTTELGKWLRTKNGVEKIGDYLFVHAGLRRDFPKTLSLEMINEEIRNSIDEEMDKDAYRKNDFIGNEGPLWYRGIAKKEESQEDIQQTLANYQAEKMIIGHTIFEQIQPLYEGKVIAIDLDHATNIQKGKMYALWIEDGQLSVTDQLGNKSPLD